eukprot:2940479-Alexandrium_andersonii.AAC.1
MSMGNVSEFSNPTKSGAADRTSSIHTKKGAVLPSANFCCWPNDENGWQQEEAHSKVIRSPTSSEL